MSAGWFALASKRWVKEDQMKQRADFDEKLTRATVSCEWCEMLLNGSETYIESASHAGMGTWVHYDGDGEERPCHAADIWNEYRKQ